MAKESKLGLKKVMPLSPQGKEGADLELSPVLHAAITLQHYSGVSNNLDLVELVGHLAQQTTGDLDDLCLISEEMLAAQAHTLDAMFNVLARRAAEASDAALEEHYLKLALRTQTQCRATWAALLRP